MKLSRLISLASIAVIILLGSVIYLNSLTGSFIWDDNNLIKDNSVIKSWSNIFDIFTSGNVSTYTGKTFHIYRPMQMLTYMGDYSLCILNPIGYHLTNILLHILAAILLYRLISLISSDRFISFVTAALFVVHPVHTEAVSYISGRADPLAAVFALLCFILYVKYLHKKNVTLFVLVILSYAASLLSRENMLVLPALLLLYNYSFKKKIDWKMMWTLIATASSYIALRLTLLKEFLPNFNAVQKTTVAQRLPGLFAAVAKYVKLIAWPQDLHMEYGDKVFGFSYLPAIVGAVLVGLIIYCAFRARKSGSQLTTFALLWFLIALIPVSNIYPIGAYMAEHWLYFPSIGLFLITAVFLRSIAAGRFMKVIAALIVILLIARYSYLTILQNLHWQDPVDFYERTLNYAPRSIRANNDLATTYEKAGMHDDAIDVYSRMLKEDPEHPDIYVNLAAIYIIKGDTEQAVSLCKKAIALEPNNATAHNNLAVAYYLQGKYDLAIEHCDLAVKYGYKVKEKLLMFLAAHRK